MLHFETKHLDTKHGEPLPKTEPSLQELGKKFGTDKAYSGVFLPFYEKHVKQWRYSKINILELGVFFGASIKMWREYFPNAQIYGLDHFTGHQGNGNVFQGSRDFAAAVQSKQSKDLDRIHLIECDQSDRKSLESVYNKLQKEGVKFHFILDDASHLMRDQQQSLGILWPLLVPGGIFFMEDWGSSLDIRYKDVKPDFSNTTLTVMKRFNDTKQLLSEYMTKQEESLLTKTIQFPIEFLDTNASTTACIRKKQTA